MFAISVKRLIPYFWCVSSFLYKKAYLSDDQIVPLVQKLLGIYLLNSNDESGH